VLLSAARQNRLELLDRVVGRESPGEGASDSHAAPSTGTGVEADFDGDAVGPAVGQGGLLVDVLDVAFFRDGRPRESVSMAVPSPKLQRYVTGCT